MFRFDGLLSKRLVEQSSEPDPGLLKLLLHDWHVRIDIRLVDPHVAIGVVAAMVMHDSARCAGAGSLTTDRRECFGTLACWTGEQKEVT